MAVDLELSRVLLALRYDSHDFRAIADDDVVRFNESIDVDPAVGAPMAPMKRDGNRTLPQQVIETYQLPGFVRKKKRRHKVAWLGGGFSNCTFTQAIH